MRTAADGVKDAVNSQSFWILTAALAAVIALGIAGASAPTGVKPPPPKPSADAEYESENRSTSVHKPVLDASNVPRLIVETGNNVIVKGKVESTHLRTSGQVFILNLGPDYRSCFKIKVFSNDFAKWSGGPDKLKRMYEGKRIGVDGKITIYEDSPEIKVNVPSQIRVLD